MRRTNRRRQARHPQAPLLTAPLSPARPQRSSVVAGAAAILLHVGCAPPTGASVAGITAGTADTGDPAVVALIQSGALYCTGALIAPRVVLTAAHCIDADPPAFVFFGQSAAGGGPSVAVAGVVTAPDFDGLSLENDLGLVILAAAPPTNAVPLAWQAASSGPLAGTAIRVVGFGTLGAGDTTAPQKRSGASVVDSDDAATFVFHAMPSQTCKGDSGGPAFADVGGVETVIGVASQGDAACLTSATDTRVDAHAAFIQATLDAVAPGAVAAGARCFIDESCAAGTCYQPADSPGFAYCSDTCTGAGACAAPLACTGGHCRYPLPSPGALGATCGENADCGSGFCAHDAATGHCSQLCFEDDACPSGFVCKANPDHPGTNACLVEVPEPESGCRVASGAGPDAGLALAGVGVFAALFARRRPRAIK